MEDGSGPELPRVSGFKEHKAADVRPRWRDLGKMGYSRSMFPQRRLLEIVILDVCCQSWILDFGLFRQKSLFSSFFKGSDFWNVSSVWISEILKKKKLRKICLIFFSSSTRSPGTRGGGAPVQYLSRSSPFLLPPKLPLPETFDPRCFKPDLFFSLTVVKV